MPQIETVNSFIEAFNRRDLDVFIATLHPEVRLHAGRGLRSGREQAREWATRSSEGVQQRIVLEEMVEKGEKVLALIVREWWWEHNDDDHEFAHRDEMAWLFGFEEGLISEWQPFDDRAAAKQALAAG